MTANGEKQIPLSELATICMLNGPAMIRNEDGLLTGYVYVDLADRAPGDYAGARSAGAAEEAATAGGLHAFCEWPVRIFGACGSDCCWWFL